MNKKKLLAMLLIGVMTATGIQTGTMLPASQVQAEETLPEISVNDLHVGDKIKAGKVKLITVEKGGAYHIYDNSSTTPGVFEADITYPGAAVLCIEE